MRVQLSQVFRFEAAHLLPHVPEGHKCRRLHGHSYQVEVVVAGEVDEQAGWLIDYQKIRDAVAPLHKQLDHYYLNDIPGLENPTSEILARWIWTRLKPSLPLAEICIAETCVNSCVYRGE